MQLREVPRPEDDENAEKKLEAIAMVEKIRNADMLQLAKELGYDSNQPSTSEKVIVFCHGQNDYLWSLLATTGSSSSSNMANITQERVEECIKQMRGLTKRDPNDLFKTQALAYDIGVDYRRMRLSLGL